MNLALIRRFLVCFFLSLFSSLLRAARLPCFLGLEVGGRLFFWDFLNFTDLLLLACVWWLCRVHREQAVGCCWVVWEPLRRFLLLPFVLPLLSTKPGECGWGGSLAPSGRTILDGLKALTEALWSRTFFGWILAFKSWDLKAICLIPVKNRNQRAMGSNFTSSCRLWSDQMPPSSAGVRESQLWLQHWGCKMEFHCCVGSSVMKNCAFTTQVWGWSELDGSGTQCSFPWAFWGISSQDWSCCGELQEQGWLQLGWRARGSQCTVTDELCEYYTSQVCREGPHFCLGCSFFNPEWTLQSRKRLLFCYHTVIIFSGFLISSTLSH